jgi:hypothetical protein
MAGIIFCLAPESHEKFLADIFPVIHPVPIQSTPDFSGRKGR